MNGKIGRRRTARQGFAITGAGLAGCLLLGGCGGGGGGVASPGSSVVTNPTATTTTPVAAVPVINYNDAEYQRSSSASAASAISAYNAGATGQGVTIGIVDSGINANSSEFAGRIASASAAFGSTSIQDVDGHGTAVASVAAAGRTGSGILGVAFNATIAAMRVDTAGSCASSEGCTFANTNIASGIDAARSAGAKVINLSLGGPAMPPNIAAAIYRATAAGIIVVIGAGNEGTANPDGFSQVAGDAAARGLVIIAGSHDASGAISSFSDKAGSFARYYLTALGERVRAPDHTGTDYLWSGTSFSAPAIAGAVALIQQAFPNLTPAQVVALLYSSATDAGASGLDAVFGNGLLNLVKAFQPVGTTSLAGSSIAVDTVGQIVTSTAMGDAKTTTQALSRAVVIDRLGRAFQMDLNAATLRIEARRPLAQAIGGNIRAGNVDLGGVSVRTTIARGFAGEPDHGLALQGRGYQRDRSQPLSGSALVRLGPNLSAGMAYAGSGQTLADLLAPDDVGGNYLAASGSRDTLGFLGRSAQAMAVRGRFGRLVIGATAERGTLAAATFSDPTTPGYATMAIRAIRTIGPIDIGLGVAAMSEQRTVLGARLGAALGSSGASTHYADADVRLRIGGGWSLKASWRQSWTRTDTGGALARGRLATQAAAIEAGYSGTAHRIGLRLSQPPRVVGGGLTLAVPTSYDYESGAIGYTAARLDLTPAGRERDLEANAGLRLGDGWLDTNIYWRRQPGNILLAPDDVGTAMRYSLRF